MSYEIVRADDGKLWIIDGMPGNYHARRVGPPSYDTWARKWELRNAIRHGELDHLDHLVVDVPGPDQLPLDGTDA